MNRGHGLRTRSNLHRVSTLNFKLTLPRAMSLSLLFAVNSQLSTFNCPPRFYTPPPPDVCFSP